MANIKAIVLPNNQSYDLKDSRVVPATTSSLGVVQPDGTTINVDNNGVISAASGGPDYGTCTTAAGTAAKTVTCSGFTLASGKSIIITFSNGNTAASPTLNVNSTGAVAVYRGSSAISAEVLAAGAHEFVYDGSHYQYVGSVGTSMTAMTEQEIATAVNSAWGGQ